MRRLIIRPGAIGDFILSIPAMRCLQTDYLEVWAASQNVPLAKFSDRARSIPSTGLDLLGVSDQPAVIELLREFDSIISWYGANRPEFRALVESLGLPFRFFPALPPDNAGMHAAEYYLNQAQSVGGGPRDAIPRLECSERQNRFAVIHPFASSRRKCWPFERYQKLAAWLEARMPVKWCAGPEEALAGAVRIPNLYELARWVSTARIYIGNDSGVAHLAAAVGTPVVALFGPTNPSVWGPRGPNVTIVRTELPGEEMDRISLEIVQEIVQATVEDLLP